MSDKRPIRTLGGRQGRTTKYVQLCDLELETQPLGTSEHDTRWGPRCYAPLPYDFPAYMRVMRLIDDHLSQGGGVSGEVRGRTLELDLFTFGIKVWVRVGGDEVKVFIEDSEGRTKVAEYTTSQEEE